MADGQVNLGSLVQALHGPAGTGGYDLVRYGRALFPDQGDEQIGAAVERSRAQGRDDQAILGEGVELAKQRVPRESAARARQIQQQYQDAVERQKALGAEQRRASTKWRLLGGLGAALAGRDPGAINSHFDQLEALNLEHGIKGAQQQRDAALGGLELEERDRQAERADVQFGQQQQDRQRDLDVRAREDDPNSEESRLAQGLATRMLGKPVQGLSASRLKQMLPALERIYQIEQQRLGREDARADRTAARGEAVAQRQADRTAAAELRKSDRVEAEERKIGGEKEEQTREIEEFAQTGFDALERLEKQIQEQGTFEMIGPEAQNFERYRTAIANAMARLSDPGSVNRPSEVESALRGLPEPGLYQLNSTALDVLKAARDELEQRRRRAYKIRGLADPEEVGPPREVRGNVVDDPPAGFGAGPVPGAAGSPFHGNPEAEQIRSAVRSGAITRDQGRQQLEALRGPR